MDRYHALKYNKNAITSSILHIKNNQSCNQYNCQPFSVDENGQ